MNSKIIMQLEGIRNALDNLIASFGPPLDPIQTMALSKHVAQPIHAPEPLATPKQSKFLFALAKQQGMTTQQLSGVLEKYGVYGGWTGDVPAAKVNVVAQEIKQFFPIPHDAQTG